jgi:hypothetical protein
MVVEGKDKATRVLRVVSVGGACQPVTCLPRGGTHAPSLPLLTDAIASRSPAAYDSFLYFLSTINLEFPESLRTPWFSKGRRTTRCSKSFCLPCRRQQAT